MVSFKMALVMARLAAVTTPLSVLGRKLRKIAEKIAASGERPLSQRELERGRESATVELAWLTRTDHQQNLRNESFSKRPNAVFRLLSEDLH